MEKRINASLPEDIEVKDGDVVAVDLETYDPK